MVTICHAEFPFAALVGKSVILALVKVHGRDFEIVLSRDNENPISLGSHARYQDAREAAMLKAIELDIDQSLRSGSRFAVIPLPPGGEKSGS